MPVARRKWFVAGALGVAVLLAATYSWWLPLPGLLLVQSSEPFQADAVVVLAGDYAGYRVQAGAELVQEGYAPKVLVSGNNWYFGHWESDIAIDFAVRHGQPREILEPFRHEATNTESELQMLFAEAQRRGWKKILMVTSNFHTRRTGMLVRRVCPPDLTVRIFAAPDRYFQPEQWWWHRESRKTMFLEWTKLVAASMGGL